MQDRCLGKTIVFFSKIGIILAMTACLPTQNSSVKDNDLNLDNKKIVQTFFDRVTDGNIAGAFELVSDDVVWWVPGDLPFSGTKTKSEYMVVVNQITSGFPMGFELKAIAMIAEGDKVAAEVVSNGNHVNGKKYNNHYHFLMQVKDGKIVAVKEYMDTLHLYKLISP